MADAGARGPDAGGAERRRERVRLGVLRVLYDAAVGHLEPEAQAWALAADLGAWTPELIDALRWLERQELVRCRWPGPAISITRRGIAYLELPERGRRPLRDEN